MIIECWKCGERTHYGGYWCKELGHFICGHCLGIDDEAEEASYRHDEEDYDDDEEE